MNAHRIGAFALDALVDFFVSSCYVGMRKPDARIFRLALDMARVEAREVAHIENTAVFVEVAEGLGIGGILHRGFESTRTALLPLGLG